MKKLLLGAFVLISVSSLAQTKFTVQGDASKVNDKITRVYLYYALNGEMKTDSIEVKEGKYNFTGQLEEPVMGRLRAAYPDSANGKKRPAVFKRDYAVVFLQPGANVKVVNTDSFANAKINGSAAHTAYLKLQDKTKDITTKEEALSKEYSALAKAKDEEGMKKLEPKFEELSNQRKEIYKAELKADPKSPLAMYMLNQVAGWDVKPEEVEPLLAALPKETQNLPAAKELREKVEIAKKTGIGRYAMDFTQNDTLGNPVKLSSFKGKYLLVDFWASWCGPCRKENPNVVKAFNKYKEKGFTIIGISLDQPTGKEKWMKAIHDDNLTWTHVSDLQYWKNAVAVQYGIQAIPQNFLLDPEGKIVAKNLDGEKLEQKLSELLDK